VRYVPTPEEEIEEIEAVTLEQLRRFHAEFYGVSAAELAIVGDFDPAEVEPLVAELFGEWRSPQPYSRLVSTYREIPAIRQSLEAPDKESAVFRAGLTIELQDEDPDYPAMVLGSFMTGGGFLNSRLATRIRQKDGLSYGVRSWFWASAWEKDAWFGAFAIYAPENAEQLETAFDEEIAAIVELGFTAEEIDEAQSGWLQSRRVSRGQDRELARRLRERDFQGRTLAWDAELEGKIAALTPDQILAAMRRHLVPERISQVQAGDFARVGKVEESAAR
jgi:zinc protease